MEHDREEVDYRGDYNFFVTLAWASLLPMHVYVCMQFACVFEYNLHDHILLQKDS